MLSALEKFRGSDSRQGEALEANCCRFVRLLGDENEAFCSRVSRELSEPITAIGRFLTLQLQLVQIEGSLQFQAGQTQFVGFGQDLPGGDFRSQGSLCCRQNPSVVKAE